MAFRSKAEMGLETARGALAESDRKVAELADSRSAALLASASDAKILALDHAAVDLAHVQKIQRDRISLLEAEFAREEAARMAKLNARHIAEMESEIEKLNDIAASYAKNVQAAAHDFHAYTDQALKCAILHSWPPGVTSACAFSPPEEFLKLAQFEHARVGTGRILSAGAVKRLNFPGGKLPTMEMAHQPENIRPLVDAVRERVAYAQKILRGENPHPTPESEMEKEIA